MTVYVDNARHRYGRMRMCHMLADTDAELLAMADRIGVARRWHQFPKTARSHFDICSAKRRLAVQHGARQISRRELGAMLRSRKEAARNE